MFSVTKRRRNQGELLTLWKQLRGLRSDRILNGPLRFAISVANLPFLSLYTIVTQKLLRLTKFCSVNGIGASDFEPRPLTKW
jgi:hypothetical protein